ncbi:dTDP-4-dehydrorhamnose 3,5-epimerase [Undibacterium sp. RuTC16W]|uniref:dTDP-4-dehydrorhamnose 3,5-epimerase n=1 Tax=Undibacterium sp. RuTC16W TaxID=3413048 RepID=UPI003BF0729F
MNIIQTNLPEVVIIEPRVFSDNRGHFYESFNAKKFADLTGIRSDFVQDNHSRSTKNVLRGMHYQIRQAQGKLVRVISGEVFDVVVDLRKSSPHFGQWTGITLSAANRLQLWIPPGFAHGFLVTSDEAEFLYKTTDYWAPEHERCLQWDDPAIGIQWPLLHPPVMSAKDQQGKLLVDAEVFE